MDVMKRIKPFCAGKKECGRENMTAPVLSKGVAVATDGRVMAVAGMFRKDDAKPTINMETGSEQASFPQWEHVVPKNTKPFMRVNRAQMLAAMEFLGGFTAKNDNGIQIQFCDGKLRMWPVKGPMVIAEITVHDLDVMHHTCIGLGASYTVKTMKAFESEEIVFEWQHESYEADVRALVVHSGTPEEMMVVLMPVRLRE